MGRLNKRKWIWAGLILLWGVVIVFFLVSLASLVVRIRTENPGPIGLKEIWVWLTDKNNFERHGSVRDLIGLVLPVLMCGIGLLGRRLQSESKQTETNQEGAQSRLAREWKRIRRNLIHTVRNHWVEGLLHHSVVRDVRIKVHGLPAPEAIAHPIAFDPRLDVVPVPLTEEKLEELFERSGGWFVIQGEPGSGKTFALLQLATRLLERAEKTKNAPVPVVVPLASWAKQRLPPKPLSPNEQSAWDGVITQNQPRREESSGKKGPALKDWLAKELLQHYNLSAALAVQLLPEGQYLTLLLDGLDEVPEEGKLREKCLQAIVEFRNEHPCAVVLCCRVMEYAELGGKPTHGDSIRILPLTPQLVGKYFDDLTEALATDPTARDRITTLRAQVHGDSNWKELATTPLMLGVLGKVAVAADFVAAPVKDVVAARELVYFAFAREMLVRKAHTTAGGEQAREVGFFNSARDLHWLQQIACGLFREGLTVFHIQHLGPAWARASVIYRLILGLYVAVNLGALGWLIRHLIFRLSGTLNGVPSDALRGGLTLGLLLVGFAALTGTLVGVVDAQRGTIQRSRPQADWTKFHHWLILGIKLGLAFALIVGPIAGPIAALVFGPALGLSLGLIYGLLDSLFGTDSDPAPKKPNQGIRSSLKCSSVAAAVGGAAGFLISWGEAGPDMALMMGAIPPALHFGGVEVLEHYALRLTLAWEGTLPFPFSDRKLIGFLDSLRDRLLLRRVGGGWMFIHRELMEFLAKEPFGKTPAEIEQTLRTGKRPSSR